VLSLLITALKRLEYRGYDSAGVAVHGDPLKLRKKEGKVSNLEAACSSGGLEGTCGMAHTRWATHGKPSDVNSHPHVSQDKSVAVVHNGVIENYQALRQQLIMKGYEFVSQTDTELLAHLVYDMRKEMGPKDRWSWAQVVAVALQQVEGAYGLVFLFQDEPDLLIGARKGSPLVLGVGQGEHMLASDASAIIEHTKDVVYIEEGQLVEAGGGGFEEGARACPARRRGLRAAASSVDTPQRVPRGVVAGLPDEDSKQSRLEMAAVVDKWDVKQMESGDKAWSQRTGPEKALFVIIQVLKVVTAVGLLYIFLISLSMMGDAFTVIGGPTAGAVFRNNAIFDNPFAGCSLGILATVLVQSSSTSTSIIITMTAAGLIDPKNAVYMIMGADIGTSVTNTIVSMSHMGDVNQYRRAFAGATVHDCFNLLTVSILLPLEYFTHMLYHIGSALVESGVEWLRAADETYLENIKRSTMRGPLRLPEPARRLPVLVESAGIEEDQEAKEKVDFIKVLTKPVTSRLISVNKKLVTKVAQACDQDTLGDLLAQSIIQNKRTQDNHMFLDTPLSDEGAGWLLLVISLVMLSTALILLVKLLRAIFRGRAAIWMQGLLNLEFKTVPFVADYILILFGVGITILTQSSSITASTLTPLVGIGLIKLDKMSPFTVGENVGATVTGMLSALAGSNVATGMTVAFSRLFFNLIGALIWFPIPAMRAVPLTMARALGSMAADVRWFPLAYIIAVFAVIPGLLLGLSLMHWAALVLVGLPLLLLLIAGSCVFGMRACRPERLPAVLKKDFSFMPPSMKMASADGEARSAAVEESKIGSTDIGGARQWWLAPCAYGLGWHSIMVLLMAVPNAKWCDVKYASFDARDHVGIGAWSACSAMFAEEVGWAPSPLAGADLDAHLATCMDGLSSACADQSGFSTGCSSATTADWLSQCEALTGCGDLHATQCANVSAAVSRPCTIDYSQSGTEWAAAPASSCSADALPKACCIPLGDLCTDVDGLTAAGGLSVGDKRDMRKVLWGTVAAFGVAWVFLLAAWASGLSALGQETTCWVQDDQNDGIVAAKGKLGDIANGAGYGLGYVIGGWALLNPILAVTALRVVADVNAGPPKKEEASEDGAAEAAFRDKCDVAYVADRAEACCQ
ncbi:unnamed protein product, partial [Prorocentrum cordatum]